VVRCAITFILLRRCRFVDRKLLASALRASPGRVKFQRRIRASLSSCTDVLEVKFSVPMIFTLSDKYSFFCPWKSLRSNSYRIEWIPCCSAEFCESLIVRKACRLWAPLFN